MTTVVCDCYVVAHRSYPQVCSMGFRPSMSPLGEVALVIEVVSVSFDNYSTENTARLVLQSSLGIQRKSQVR